jgi:hypothetical protein
MLSMDYGSRMSKSLIVIDALSSASWKKKKKKKKEKRSVQVPPLPPGLEASYALLSVQHWIFVAVRCN